MNKRETMKAAQTLASIHNSRNGEKVADVVKKAAHTLGGLVLVETVAAIVQNLAHDGRISQANKDHAAQIETATAGAFFSGVDSIHPAHVDQLAAHIFKHADELATVEANTMQTPEEIADELATVRERIKEAQKDEADALAEWETLTTAEKFNTPHEARAIRKAEAARKDRAHLEKIRAILENNRRAAMWQRLAPILAEILQKYAGKPYGEKTAEKMRGEMFARCQHYFYIDRANPYRVIIREITRDGYATHATPFEIWTAWADNSKNFLTDSNKINTPHADAWGVCGLKDYQHNPAETVATLDRLKAKAEQLAQELRETVRTYNSIAPAGVEPLKD